MLNILLGVGFSGAFVTICESVSRVLALLHGLEVKCEKGTPRRGLRRNQPEPTPLPLLLLICLYIASGKAYPISFSPTLVASTAGLLSLLVITLSESSLRRLRLGRRADLALFFALSVFVPLNGYHITRRWGVFLIGFYVVSMVSPLLFSFLFGGFTTKRAQRHPSLSSSLPLHLLPPLSQTCNILAEVFLE